MVDSNCYSVRYVSRLIVTSFDVEGVVLVNKLSFGSSDDIQLSERGNGGRRILKNPCILCHRESLTLLK